MDSVQLFQEEIQRSKLFYSQGQYQQCLRSLSSIVPAKLSVSSLVVEHNTIICNHLVQAASGTAKSQTKSKSNTGTAKPKNIKQHALYDQTLDVLNHLIRKLQGLPPHGTVLEVECAAVYNSVYVHLLRESIQDVHAKERSQLSSTVINCLRRVGGNARHVSMQSDGQDETIHNQFINISLQVLKSGLSDRMRAVAVPLVVLYCGYLLLTDLHPQTPIPQVLEACRLQADDLKPLEHVFTFSLTSRHDVGFSTQLKEVSVLFESTAYYTCSRFTECVDVLSRNKEGPTSPTAVYVKGCALYQLGRYAECVSCLDTITKSEDVAVLSGMALNLAGSCLSKQGALQSSVQYFQRALHLDYANPCTLYNIALQYRHMARGELELDTLELLLRVLDKPPPESQDPVMTLDVGLLSISQVTPLRRLSLTEALYLVASRYAELNRHEKASEKYLDLISLLVTRKVRPKKVASAHQASVSMPDAVVIFHQAAYALLSCERYADAVAICDQILDNHDPHDICSAESQSQSQDSAPEDGSSSPSISVQSRKRARSSSTEQSVAAGDSGEWWRTCEQDVIALKYKADALYKMGDYDEALMCLDRLVTVLENNGSNDVKADVPATKRQRLGSDAPKEDEGPVTTFSVDAYVAKAIVQDQVGKVKSALHSSQQAVTLCPDNTLALFTHCILLLRQERQDEALRLWTRTRHIDTRHMDSLHLDRLLQNKRNQTRNSCTSLPRISPTEPGEEDKILLDIVCLQYAQQQALKRRKLF